MIARQFVGGGEVSASWAERFSSSDRLLKWDQILARDYGYLIAFCYLEQQIKAFGLVDCKPFNVCGLTLLIRMVAEA